MAQHVPLTDGDLFFQVYAGIFPIDAGEFPRLEESVERVRPLLRLPLTLPTADSQLTMLLNLLT